MKGVQMHAFCGWWGRCGGYPRMGDRCVASCRDARSRVSQRDSTAGGRPPTQKNPRQKAGILFSLAHHPGYLYSYI